MPLKLRISDDKKHIDLVADSPYGGGEYVVDSFVAAEGERLIMDIRRQVDALRAINRPKKSFRDPY